jgi:hypothetical protein
LLTTDIIIDVLLRSRKSSAIISIDFSFHYKNSGINSDRFSSADNAIMKDKISYNLELNNFLIICSGYSNIALIRFIYIKKESLNIYSAVEIYTLSDLRSGTPLKLENIKKEDKTRFRVL